MIVLIKFLATGVESNKEKSIYKYVIPLREFWQLTLLKQCFSLIKKKRKKDIVWRSKFQMEGV